jgi:hypothetical protein
MLTAKIGKITTFQYPYIHQQIGFSHADIWNLSKYHDMFIFTEVILKFWYIIVELRDKCILRFKWVFIHTFLHLHVLMDIEHSKKHSYLDEYKIIKTLGAGYHAQ